MNNKYYTVFQMQHGFYMLDIFTDNEEIAIIIGDIELQTAETILLALGYGLVEVGF